MAPLIAPEQHNSDKSFHSSLLGFFLVIKHEIKDTAISTLCIS